MAFANDNAAKGSKQSRRAMRSFAFQVLYSLSFNMPDSVQKLKNGFLNALAMKDAESLKSSEDASVQDNPEGFAWDLVYGVWSKMAELDNIISKHSERWKVERLGRIELTLLRMGVFEIYYNREVPLKVIISEALELAKQYADQKALAFINGVLDASAKEIDTE